MSREVLIRIHQCPMTVSYCFREYDDSKFNKHDYVCVNSVNLYTAKPDLRICEDMYVMFNDRTEYSYHHRSLSMSDVVEIINKATNTSKAYYCDSVGFTEVTDWFN